ncbi:MAG: ABC transporter ATP-binding protein [Candidatus Enterosoma sp.]|nr:ABC transporter ATP-binding protein [bacterium]MDY5866078.1 ABC transporter ATP-binding protein [Candidatus Enterosoma sp.]
MNYNFKRSLFSFFKGSFKKKSVIFFSFLSFCLLIVSSSLLFYFSSGLLYQIINTGDILKRNVFIVLITMMFFFFLLTDYLFLYMLNTIVIRFINEMKMEFFMRIKDLRPEDMSKDLFLFTYNIYYRDLINLELSFAKSFVNFINELVIITVIFVFSMSFNYLLFSISLLFLPVLLIMYFISLLSMSKMKDRENKSKGKLTSFYYNSYTASYIFKAMQCDQLRKRDNERLSKEDRKLSFLIHIFDSFISSLFFLSIFLSLFFVLFFRAYFFKNNIVIDELAYVVISAFSIFFNIYFSSLLIDVKNLVMERKNVRNIKEIINISFEDDKKIEIETVDEIEFKNVSVCKEGRYLISDFSMKIKKGDKLSIIGQTGSGKSLLLSLILNKEEATSGKILINGIDINLIKKDSIKNNFFYISSEGYIYKTTFRNNLTLGKKVEDELLISLLKELKLDYLLDDLEDGLNTVIDSYQLSRGEKEKINLIRCILSDKKVFIFDQATSYIDTFFIHDYFKDFVKQMKDKIFINVTDRISELKTSSSIIVLKDGRLVEQGDMDELMKLDGFFASFFNEGFTFN